MPGRHLPADHSRGDANTIGGYIAVHDRPAAFEGSDGLSYSVEICADETGERDRPFGAYFLFLRWRRIGEAAVEGHVETDFLAHGMTEAEARDRIGTMKLSEVRQVLEAALRARAPGESRRRWWDAMRDEDGP
jgi:hypothetical protein